MGDDCQWHSEAQNTLSSLIANEQKCSRETMLEFENVAKGISILHVWLLLSLYLDVRLVVIEKRNAIKVLEAAKKLRAESTPGPTAAPFPRVVSNTLTFGHCVP